MWSPLNIEREQSKLIERLIAQQSETISNWAWLVYYHFPVHWVRGVKEPSRTKKNSINLSFW